MLSSIGRRSCKIVTKEKNTLVTQSCLLSDALFSRPNIINLRSRDQIRVKLLLFRKLRHFRGSVFSQYFIHYQPLPITRYQVRFYVNNCFE